VRIEVGEIGLPPDERKAIERRVLLVLSRVGPELTRVVVSLVESRNPLGGLDRECRLRAGLRAGGELRCEANDETFEAAVARAAGQVAQRMDEALSRESSAGGAAGARQRGSRVPPKKPRRR
jgi:hypothetical protein